MDKIQEAVEYCEFVIVTDEGRKIVQPLLNLATRYLSASEDMPEIPMAKSCEDSLGECYYYDCEDIKKYKDDCTLAVAKNYVLRDKLPSYNEIFELVKESSLCHLCLSNVSEGEKEMKELATAIAERIGK